MKRFLSFILVGMLLLAPLSSWGDSDRYLGDASIYGPTNLNNPNILIIIDNSHATLNAAAGQQSIPIPPIPNTASAPGISQMDNQGEYSIVSVVNPDNSLQNLTCSWTSVIQDTLLGERHLFRVGFLRVSGDQEQPRRMHHRQQRWRHLRARQLSKLYPGAAGRWGD